jgi:hypothetical protein
MHATNLSAPPARAAVSRRIPRLLTAVLGPLAALGLLLSLQGCGTTAAATTSVTGPTPAGALQIFNAYVTAEKVALTNHDELLALSLLTGSQYTITNAAYTAAAAAGRTVGGPVYGPPTLYVPKLTTYPQWFMATAPERPASGGAIRTALLVFDRLSAETTWALSGSVLLNPGTAALQVATDRAGYATALATSDPALKLRPDIVGAIHATVADDGPSSAAASIVQPGPQTTGLYRANAAIARQAAAHQLTYTWELEGTSYPFFALRTTGGGALVFYTMTLTTLTVPTKLPPPHSTVTLPTIPVPAAFKDLLPAIQPPIQHQLSANSTLSYVALDPAASAKTPAITVIGGGGGPTYAHGS